MRYFFLQNWTTVGNKRITGPEYQENWILTTQTYDVGWSKIPHQCFVLLLLCTILHVGQFFWKNIPKSLVTMSMPGPLRIGSWHCNSPHIIFSIIKIKRVKLMCSKLVHKLFVRKLNNYKLILISCFINLPDNNLLHKYSWSNCYAPDSSAGSGKYLWAKNKEILSFVIKIKRLHEHVLVWLWENFSKHVCNIPAFLLQAARLQTLSLSWRATLLLLGQVTNNNKVCNNLEVWTC